MNLSRFKKELGEYCFSLALVSVQHVEIKERGTMNWLMSHKESASASVTLPTPLADSKGDLPQKGQRKQRCVLAKTTFAPLPG